ncbi:MAG: DUF2267 domain-containing protein [Actinoplanes sp.]
MGQDDLLARVQRNGRLYGPNESRRAICAVVDVLGELLPEPAYRRLVASLPADIRQRLPWTGAGRFLPVAGVRAFVARLVDRLHTDGPDAAFLARVVLTQLNADGYGPAALAPLVPADLRPLLRAGAPVIAATVPAVRRVGAAKQGVARTVR